MPHRIWEVVWKQFLKYFSQELPIPQYLYISSRVNFTFTFPTITMKFTYIMGTSFTKLRLYFHEVSFIIHTLSTFVWDAVCWLHNTLCRSVDSFHACCVSAQLHLLNDVLRLHPSGGQKYGSRKVLHQGRREEEGEQSIPLLEMPLYCAHLFAVWRCHAEGGLDSFSCLCKPFELAVLTS